MLQHEQGRERSANYQFTNHGVQRNTNLYVAVGLWFREATVKHIFYKQLEMWNFQGIWWYWGFVTSFFSYYSGIIVTCIKYSLPFRHTYEMFVDEIIRQLGFAFSIERERWNCFGHGLMIIESECWEHGDSSCSMVWNFP